METRAKTPKEIELESYLARQRRRLQAVVRIIKRRFGYLPEVEKSLAVARAVEVEGHLFAEEHTPLNVLGASQAIGRDVSELPLTLQDRILRLHHRRFVPRIKARPEDSL